MGSHAKAVLNIYLQRVYIKQEPKPEPEPVVNENDFKPQSFTGNKSRSLSAKRRQSIVGKKKVDVFSYLYQDAQKTQQEKEKKVEKARSDSRKQSKPKLETKDKKIKYEGDFLARMKEYENNHKQAQDKARVNYEKDVYGDVTFRPKINKEHDSHVKDAKSIFIIIILEDVYSVLYERARESQEKLRKQIDQYHEEELRGCTFKPEIYTKNDTNDINNNVQVYDRLYYVFFSIFFSMKKME